MLKKIVVIGPESTGKSSLCEELAQHYGTSWCPEFAREYLLTKGKKYDYEDLLFIAKGQLALEDEYVLMQKNQSKAILEKKINVPLFIDTDMYVMKVWCEFVFERCHPFILEEILNRKYDLYLLCNVDLPWVKDELREYPDLETRKKLYRAYLDIMVNQPVPWTVIEGDPPQRLDKAITAINQLL